MANQQDSKSLINCAKDIIQSMQTKSMGIIRKEFENYNESMTIHQFVEVMLKNLSYENKNKNQLTLNLIKFFNEVDVNGDGDLTWQEFSNYIIDLGLVINNEDKNDQIKNYYASQIIVDKVKHENDIEKLYYIEKIKSLLIIEKDSSKFKLLNPFTQQVTCEIKAHKTPILSAEYLSDLGIIVTSSNDLTINFWDQATLQLKHSISVPELQLLLRYANWSSTTKYLYTGGSDSTIRYYDVITYKEIGVISNWAPYQKNTSNIKGHFGAITDIIPIYSQQIIASSSMDGKICLWDFPSHQFRKELTGHEKGVYSLEWNEYYPQNTCLLSTGFEHDIFIWNTYVKQKIFQLKGHNFPLLGVKSMPNTPQVISVDIKGVVKIWDITKYQCRQSFNLNTDLSTFCLTYPKKLLIFASHQLQYYEYDEIKDSNICDEYPCIKALFSRELNCFITIHPFSVKIWDDKGQLISTHKQKQKNEIVNGCIDHRELKLFIATNKGKLFTMNIKNGAKMRKYQKCMGNINDIACWKSASDNEKQIRRIITASSDLMVNIHDEDFELDNYTVCYQVKNQKKQNSISVMDDILVNGSDDGQIIVYNFLNNRQDILYHHKNQVKMIQFLKPHKCLVISDQVGVLTFITTQNLSINNKYMCSKQIRSDKIKNNMEVNAQINACAFYDKENLLFIGDELGFMTIWNIRNITYKNNLITKLDTFDLELQSMIENNNQQKTRLKSFQSQDILDNQDLKYIPHFDISSYFNSNDDIYEVKEFKCHNDGITSISILSDEKLILSSGHDFCVHLWSLKDFQKLGSFTQSENSNWQVIIDRTQIDENNANEVKSVLKQINQYDDDNEQQHHLNKDKKQILQNAKGIINKFKQYNINKWEESQNKNSQIFRDK